MNKTSIPHVATVTKLIHGGQGLGELEDGRKVLLWNALPGEKVRFLPKKRKSSYLEGIGEELVARSPERIEPRDELYLSTSPWQILAENREDHYKQEILRESYERGGLSGVECSFLSTDNFWEYRNKMEYSFYGDEDGLHLALFSRGSHRKQIVTGSSIAVPIIDVVAGKLVRILHEASIRASDLKSVIIRANQRGEAVVALFTRNEDFPSLHGIEDIAKGVVVVYSNPKSPASVRTKDLYTHGDINLTDHILDTDVGYDVFSFFQVNIPVFESALKTIREFVGQDMVVDFYSGVGSIGLVLPGTVSLVETDPQNIFHARRNVANAGATVEVVEASSENALDYIQGEGCLVVDPPRAGLHSAVTEKIIKAGPPKVAYLSCNPSTQVRDIALLAEQYSVEKIVGYNFFPRTPHIESLVFLKRK